MWQTFDKCRATSDHHVFPTWLALPSNMIQNTTVNDGCFLFCIPQLNICTHFCIYFSINNHKIPLKKLTFSNKLHIFLFILKRRGLAYFTLLFVFLMDKCVWETYSDRPRGRIRAIQGEHYWSKIPVQAWILACTISNSRLKVHKFLCQWISLKDTSV